MLNDSKAWEAAFEQWLADKSPHTQRAYRRAWDDLLAYSGKAPWDIKEGDVRAWIEDLAQRPLDRCVARRRQRRGQRSGKQGKGLSDSTIALWLAAVSSLYQFATEYRVRSEVGGESPLHNHNPVAAVQRPRQGFSPQADYLDPMQLRRLIGTPSGAGCDGVTSRSGGERSAMHLVGGKARRTRCRLRCGMPCTPICRKPAGWRPFAIRTISLRR